MNPNRNEILKKLAPSLKMTFKKISNLSCMGLILACLFFIIPLCSLPPMRWGYYSQTEMSTVSFWALSAVSCLWIYCLWQKNPFLVSKTSRLPIVWGPLFLGLVTLAVCVFHTLPLRDFVGSGQMGEGALTFMASGIMACHFSIVTRFSLYRKIIFITAVLVGILISVLTVIGSMDSPFISWRYWKWASFFFPDFLAFITISLLTAYFYIRKELRGIPYLNDIIAIILFAVIGYYTNNKSLNYGLAIAGMAMLGIRVFPHSWHRNLLHLSFFGLSFGMTLLIIFYDEFSRLLPASLGSLGHLYTITSRTWLSKIALIDLWYNPLNVQEIQKILIGNGWGTFSNISTANMFLIDQVSLFSGKEYQPSWELVNRDLLHTHNILTNMFHCLGLAGVSLYLYIQYKLINSLSRNTFLLGVGFLIVYQTQLLFWFQFLMTIPFTLLALSLLFREHASKTWIPVFKPHSKPKFLWGLSACLLTFSALQGVVAIGYTKGLMHRNVQSNAELIDTLASKPYYVQLESAFGAQRQVSLARIYAITIQKEFEKSPQMLATHSLRLVDYLTSLPKGGNYLASNVAINILSELAAKPETSVYLGGNALRMWEQIARDHIEIMPYRSDILLPFFNFYQTLGKESLVLDLTSIICSKNPHDPIGLWFMGSSLLKNPARFDECLCILHKALQERVERFMPVPPALKSKIMAHATACQ